MYVLYTLIISLISTFATKVAPFSLSGAGEGLFAKVDLRPGDLVALFNGVRLWRPGRGAEVAGAGEEAPRSDYGITLSRDLSLDIPQGAVDLKR